MCTPSSPLLLCSQRIIALDTFACKIEVSGKNATKVAGHSSLLILIPFPLLFASSQNLDFLNHFPNLVSITVMRQPAMTTLSASTFSTLTQLESLWITDCGLSSLPKLLFCYNSSLKNLHLSGNRLTNSDIEAAFENLDSLRQLWLNDNRLDSLRGLSNLVNLKSLWLCRNKIERIGEKGRSEPTTSFIPPWP